MRDHTPEALRNAKRLRRDMSLPEALLRRLLRQRPMGVKFRRQHPIGNFVADSYCAERSMVIEIDGILHDAGNRPERDEARDAWLRSCGKQVVRIAAKDVLRSVEGVADSLVRMCLDKPPPSAASRLSPPPEGEDL